MGLYEIALTPVSRHVKVRGKPTRMIPHGSHTSSTGSGCDGAQPAWATETSPLMEGANGLCPICREKITK